MITRMTRDERILKDLTNNLRDKILDNLGDFIDLCGRADLDDRDVACEAMQLLIRISTGYAAHRFNITAEDYITAVGAHFRHAKEQI